MKKASVFGLALLFLCASFPAAAQTSVIATATVSFDFMAGGQTFPAGSYRIEHVKTPNYLVLRSVDGKHTGNVKILTRLNPSSGSDIELVFDEVGNQRYLAEIEMPGMQGFHLQGAPGEHTHMSVKVSKK